MPTNVFYHLSGAALSAKQALPNMMRLLFHGGAGLQWDAWTAWNVSGVVHWADGLSWPTAVSSWRCLNGAVARLRCPAVVTAAPWDKCGFCKSVTMYPGQGGGATVESMAPLHRYASQLR